MDVTNIEARLREELAQVTTDLTEIALYNEVSGDWEPLPSTESLSEPDENDEADAVETNAQRQSTVAALETTFRDINRSLAALAAGTYGICEYCGNEIEEKRLAILRSARTCIAHKDETATLPL